MAENLTEPIVEETSEWNFMPVERFQELSRNVSNALQTNPEALGQLADIIGDVQNLHDELGRRSDTISELEEQVRSLNDSVLQMATRQASYDSRTAERRAVANSENRVSNGEFAGYNRGSNDMRNGYEQYRNEASVGAIGTENPGESLIASLIDEKGEWR